MEATTHVIRGAEQAPLSVRNNPEPAPINVGNKAAGQARLRMDHPGGLPRKQERNPSMKSLILASLLLLPLAAQADDDGSRCAHSQPRNLQLDLAGVDTVVFDIGGNDLDLRAAAGGAGRIDGRACASDEKYFDDLVLEQKKTGATLVVRTRRDGASTSNFNFSFLGIGFSRYAYMQLKTTLPDNLAVELKVGSGDASVTGVRALDATIGSGDLVASSIRGRFSGSAGSGDIRASDIGSLDLRSIGSGDATIRQVRGASKVGTIGSGDLAIRGTQGPVEIGSTGSGDVELTGIGGDVSLGSTGSGDLDFADIRGNVTVGSIGSGDLDVNGVRGNLSVRSVGSGDVDHRNVDGRIDLPKKR